MLVWSEGRKTNKPADREATEELITERLSLSNSTKASVANLLGIKLHTLLWKIKPLLYHWCQFPYSPSFLTCTQPTKGVILNTNPTTHICICIHYTQYNIYIYIPRTFWVRVALIMISVRIGVILTSTPE